MNYSTERAAELEPLEDRYADLEDTELPLEPAQPLAPRYKIVDAIREHSSRRRLARVRRLPRVRHCTTEHVNEVLAREVLHAEKGNRPGYIVLAERSLDQILDTVQTIGELAVSPDYQ